VPNRPAVVGVIRHQLHRYANGEFYVTTIWVKHPSAVTNAMVTADQDVLYAWSYTYWNTKARNTYALRTMKAWDMGTTIPTKKNTVNVYPLTTDSGSITSSTPALPAAMTLAISLRTGTVGQTPKPPSGRIFHVGGVSANLVGEDGLLSQANADAYKDVYDHIRTGLTNTGNIGQWVVVSYYSGGHRGSPVLRATPQCLPITHLQTDRRIDLLHKRLPRQQSFVTN
jgi:hypothetical protein